MASTPLGDLHDMREAARSVISTHSETQHRVPEHKVQPLTKLQCLAKPLSAVFSRLEVHWMFV